MPEHLQDEGRAERIARYKEQRRRELAARFGSDSPTCSPLRGANGGGSSGSDGGPRTTRTSRLRAAMVGGAKDERLPATPPAGAAAAGSCDSTPNTNRRIERDKSSKRKSNLNRALTSEEVPPGDNDDPKSRRRRRRFFPQELLDQNNENKSTTTASTSPNTASPRLTPRKSDLSMHMENARKGVTSPFTERTKTPENRRKSLSEVKNQNKPSTPTISKKMEELTALTKETLARVEKLASKNKTGTRTSILKKKLSEEAVIIESVVNTGPVSILKRIDHKSEASGSSNHTPPVTFSPSVVEPTTTNRKQGILKKRRSLDESQVLRHRSCSPDVANKMADSRSILKKQRRSSLEELTRMQSPEPQLHGILKRKTSRTDEDDHSLNSPQSILKRRSGASSAGSTSNSPHVSITTAVILAAAGGAEMVLEPETVKPILKKKSFSEEHSLSDTSEPPKPILKKKSSTDTDDCDDRPKKPILKITRNSSDRDSLELGSGEECEVKPILKQKDDVRPRLSFCGEESMERVGRSRRSHTICAEFGSRGGGEFLREEDRDLKKPRPLSVFDLVMNFEGASTGAIPKRSSLKRNSDRYRTQPVTSNELEASLNFVRSPQQQLDQGINSILDFTSSLENDTNLNNFLPNHSPDSGVCKMSSDSAFQSLGDGLELDQEEDNNVMEATSRSGKLETGKLELQMKAIAEEAQKMRLGKGNAGVQKYRNRKVCPSERSSSSRFSTQPVTFDEVQEAARINNNDEAEDKENPDPSKLSLSERIKLFSPKVEREVPRRRSNRFSTQPVTSDEVETARFISPKGRGLDASGKTTPPSSRGILKPPSHPSPSPRPRSTILRRDSFEFGQDRRSSSLKTADPSADVTYDEGISCNDSASDSEGGGEAYAKSPEVTRRSGGGSETSDGDSSGGREIRSILGSEGKMNIRQRLENVLSKSKSHQIIDEKKRQSITSSPRTPITSKITSSSSSIRRSQTQSAIMPKAIEELQARLQQSGESEWKKRVQQNNNTSDELRTLNMNRYNTQLSEKSILEIRKDELDAASKEWKNRVEKSDAEKFSVAGRMEKNREESNLPINIPLANNKKTPQAKRFKGKEGSDSSSTPVSPDKTNKHIELTRSYSVPDPDHDSSGSESSTRSSGRKVAVARPDDDTFQSFYKSTVTSSSSVKTTNLELSLDDFDSVTRHSLLVQKKNVQMQRRRGATSRNPVKALALRTDITNEYTEFITGVAERERKRQNIEKLAKGSNFAQAAIAGLVSNEDFKNVNLKKSTHVGSFNPYKATMLLQVKGRQHVQTRLIEPNFTNINEGDCYILITPTTLYSYVGKYSNVIEQSRTAEIVNHIQQSGDLGCKVIEIVNLSSGNISMSSRSCKGFVETIGLKNSGEFVGGGNPDEDGIFESNILATNMIYKLEESELVPYDDYWGKIPKIEMLESTKVIVFDFGSEMYVWSGKNAPLDKKKLAFRLAKEMWDLGYDYSGCSINPLNVAKILGNRTQTDVIKQGSLRPSWALFAKITQHRETILFKEKFLDWPDFSRVIRVKGDQNGKNVDPAYNIKPCDVKQMLEKPQEVPDLKVENYHLGRGDQYFDEETKRLYEFETLKVSVWRIQENHPEELPETSIGQFFNSDSYIVKWTYRTTVKGRELSGKPSKYMQAGRDKIIYFCWQGSKASINEKGSAALLTVELDHEKAPQIRVVQGAEPACFLKIFKGTMVVYDGKSDNFDMNDRSRLFILRGEISDELALIEVPCESKQLRSRTSFVHVEPDFEKVTIWHGCKATEQVRMAVRSAANALIGTRLLERVREVEEEDGEFLGGDGYASLIGSELDCDCTMRLFHMSSVSKRFEATEVVCPHRSEFSSPFPFLQGELYSASQPALFLLDDHHTLYLWQGWWPEREEEEEIEELSDQTGSGAVRWQAERKAAMQTTLDYWRKKHQVGGDDTVPAFLVWAGLEPLEFKNLFPHWEERDDVSELNAKLGKKMGAKLGVEGELARLSRSVYPLDELMQRPLPDGVDPTHLEDYLSGDDFKVLFEMRKEEWKKLPQWKQTELKKEKRLF